MNKIILDILNESITVKKSCIENNLDLISACAGKISECISRGNKILLFGNGGSAADAQHIAAEFVNRFQIERPPLAAMALTANTSVLTSIGNDYSFDDIFSKQITAFGKKGDIAIGISTSGNSRNVINAVNAAKKMGIFTIALTGRSGELAKTVDMPFPVDSDVTARIQEAHITLGHILCALVDRILYGEKFK